jgi:putative PIG3 family NAD(P)H quinone oxidoreductase
MTLPLEQNTVLITAAGGPEVLQPRRAATPQPGPDDILIEVAYGGVNRHDCGQRARGPVPAHSDIPGLEASGVVRAIGARVRDFKVGQRVCALTDGGSYAQYVCTPAGHAFAVPDSMDLRDAAALPEALFTTWHNVYDIARIAAGESILIHGGTSGVGSIAVQLLAALGHPVYATCGTDEKCGQAVKLGARAAYNYRAQQFEDELSKDTAGRGVDVIFDMSGADYAVRNVKSLARGGRLVYISGGANAQFDVPLRMIMEREARISGSRLRPLSIAEKTIMGDALRRAAWPLAEAGRIKPIIAKIFPLARACDAHALMESGVSMGKILLDPNAASTTN